MTARVSVLMTVYNAAPFLRESVDSVIAQSFSNWELIAFDDGSTDGSLEILQEYKEPRIKIFSLSKNIGRTPALRYAMDQAQGEYIAVLDADDKAHPKRLATQLEFLDKHPEVVLAGSWVEHIDEKGRNRGTWEPPPNMEELQECLGWINPIVHSSAMYRREAALAAGGYPLAYAYAQDFALILNILKYGKLAVIDERLCQYRIFSRNLSNLSKHARVVAIEGLALMKCARAIIPLSNKARRMNRCAVAKYEIRWGLAMIRTGDIFLGLKKILGALISNPDVLWTNQLFRSPFQAI